MLLVWFIQRVQDVWDYRGWTRGLLNMKSLGNDDVHHAWCAVVVVVVVVVVDVGGGGGDGDDDGSGDSGGNDNGSSTWLSFSGISNL